MISDQFNFSASCVCITCVLRVRTLTGRPAARSSSLRATFHVTQTNERTKKQRQVRARMRYPRGGGPSKFDKTLCLGGRVDWFRCVPVIANCEARTERA